MTESSEHSDNDDSTLNPACLDCSGNRQDDRMVTLLRGALEIHGTPEIHLCKSCYDDRVLKENPTFYWYDRLTDKLANLSLSDQKENDRNDIIECYYQIGSICAADGRDTSY